MSTGRRKVVVMAVGAAATMAAVVATFALLDDEPADGGWFNYAPDNGQTFTEYRTGVGTGDLILVGALWAVLAAAWLAAGIWLIRSRDR